MKRFLARVARSEAMHVFVIFSVGYALTALLTVALATCAVMP